MNWNVPIWIKAILVNLSTVSGKDYYLLRQTFHKVYLMKINCMITDNFSRKIIDEN
jgi:hypothetical protein